MREQLPFPLSERREAEKRFQNQKQF